MKPVIEAENLTFAYHRRHDVLCDINLAVEPGSFYALLGRNGAGKSTLLKILAGALEPGQGISRTLGTDSLHLGVEEWRAIGFVLEAQPLYNWLTGAELLRFTSQLYPNWDTAFCDQLCRTLDLPLERKVGHYSKGERMKFILLLAMAFHPRLLLLDEPFGGLDVVAKEQLISCLLETTGQEQWSVVCASHDLAEVERLGYGGRYVYLTLNFTERKPTAGHWDDHLGRWGLFWMRGFPPISPTVWWSLSDDEDPRPNYPSTMTAWHPSGHGAPYGSAEIADIKKALAALPEPKSLTKDTYDERLHLAFWQEGHLRICDYSRSEVRYNCYELSGWMGISLDGF